MVLSKERHFEHLFILGINKWLSTQKPIYKITIGVRIMWGEVTQPNQLIEQSINGRGQLSDQTLLHLSH